MDVSAPRPPDAIDAASRRHERIAPAAATTTPGPRPDAAPPPDAVEPGRWMPHSTLKFTLSAADVEARFEIHEATSTVTVTMYERETGEVLRELPSRAVLDTIASLTSLGMQVNTIS